MNTGSGVDSILTAWLCAQLPRLATDAARHRWVHKLDAALADIRAGTPVAQALADHHLPVDPATARGEQARIARGDPGVLGELGIDPVDVIGTYTCPATRLCLRRAQPGPSGHEPRCGIHGKTMVLRSQEQPDSRS